MTLEATPDRATRMAHLLALAATPEAHADPLRPVLASLLVGRAQGEGVLSSTLGLTQGEFQRLVADYFAGMNLTLIDGGRADVEELADLVPLLLTHQAGRHASESWLAHIVAAGCAGADHLWQDLGLANRGELNTLMQTAFPTLAALNVTDMKWKKFLYRQYCSTEGLYLCPAPSCGECADFHRCHAPES